MENTEPVKPANDTQDSESVDDEESNELFDTVDNGEEGDPVGPERPGGRFRRWRQRRREKQRARARMRAELQPLDEVEPEKKQLVREEYLLVVSRRMVWITLSVLLVVVGTFGPTVFLEESRFPVSWFSFGVGVLGGFVSLQQRLSKILDEELFHLRYHWVNVLLVPLFGGIFALLFYLFTLSGTLEGAAFPTYTPDPATTADLSTFFGETYPASGEDFAKLALWAFAAGFSERLVPNLITQKVGRLSDNPGQGGDK